jgi:hypothetical protein
MLPKVPALAAPIPRPRGLMWLLGFRYYRRLRASLRSAKGSPATRADHIEGERGQMGDGMSRRLNLRLKAEHALEVTRIAIGSEKLVYVLLANKEFKYEYGRKSHIAYIGTTKKGVARIAESAAKHAQEVLSEHGVKTVAARVVTCAPRRKVKTWVKLEKALLLQFRAEYGRVPWWNSQGGKLTELDEFRYFSREAVRGLLQKLG